MGNTIEISDLIHCPCGATYKTLGHEKSYGIHGNLYICPTCRGVSYVNIHALMGNSYIKFYPFSASIGEFKRQALEFLLERTDLKTMSKISNIEVKKYFVPVREFESGTKRYIIPLCDNDYTEGLISDKMPCSVYDNLFPGYDGLNLTADFLSAEIDNVNKLKYSEFLKITTTDDSLRYEYGIQPQKFYVIRYWPIFILTFLYKEKEYFIKNFGILPIGTIVSNFADKPTLTPDEYYNHKMKSVDTNFSAIGTCLTLTFIASIIVAIENYNRSINDGFFSQIISVVWGVIAVGICCGIVYLILSKPLAKFFSKAFTKLKSCNVYLGYWLYKRKYVKEHNEMRILGSNLFQLSSI